MLRAIGKTCFAYVYTLADARRFYRRQGGGPRPFILCSTLVVENFNPSSMTAIPSMLISTRMFERQIEWLAKRFSFLSLDEIGSHIESGHQFQPPGDGGSFRI